MHAFAKTGRESIAVYLACTRSRKWDGNQEPGLVANVISGSLSAEQHQSIGQRIEIHFRPISRAGLVVKIQLCPRLSVPSPRVVQSRGRAGGSSVYDDHAEAGIIGHRWRRSRGGAIRGE